MRGRQGEDCAASFLLEAGWLILARNFRGKRGEIDIIVQKKPEIAFVEVKIVDAFGLESISRSVGADKRRRIIETSKLFLAMHREYSNMILRYDVIVVRDGRQPVWLERAFSEQT